MTGQLTVIALNPLAHSVLATVQCPLCTVHSLCTHRLYSWQICSYNCQLHLHLQSHWYSVRFAKKASSYHEKTRTRDKKRGLMVWPLAANDPDFGQCRSRRFTLTAWHTLTRLLSSHCGYIRLLSIQNHRQEMIPSSISPFSFSFSCPFLCLSLFFMPHSRFLLLKPYRRMTNVLLLYGHCTGREREREREAKKERKEIEGRKERARKKGLKFDTATTSKCHTINCTVL